MERLKFKNGNAKVKSSIYTFTLPAGYTCPGAKECLAKANRETGKVEDGPHTKFRCSAASTEVIYRNLRDMVWHNLRLLEACKTIDEMVLLIASSLPQKAKTVRVHVGGDFYKEMYFKAWLKVAKLFPETVFYGYTKSIPFLVKYRDEIPGNFRFTASFGGKWDNLVSKHELKSCTVCFSEKEAKDKGLRIDKGDALALNYPDSFAVLLHGTMPAGSEAAVALQLLRKAGKGGYSRNKKKKG